MSPRGSLVVRWALLTATALTLGTTIGAAYAIYVKEPTQPLDDAAARVDLPPAAPMLLTPEHATVVDSVTPELTWVEPADDSPGELAYVVELGFDKDFSFGIVREYFNIREPRLQIPDSDPLPPGVTVYWRVYALDTALNQGPYSPIFAFTPLSAPPVPVPPLH